MPAYWAARLERGRRCPHPPRERLRRSSRARYGSEPCGERQSHPALKAHAWAMAAFGVVALLVRQCEAANGQGINRIWAMLIVENCNRPRRRGDSNGRNNVRAATS